MPVSIRAAEERDLGHISAARPCSNLRHEIHGRKDWVEKIFPGIAVKEWRHQPVDPKVKTQRRIVVRKQTSRHPPAGGKAAL